MPYCEDCGGWYPRTYDACASCGGALTAERPEGLPVATSPGDHEGDRSHSWAAYLPGDFEVEGLGLDDARRIVGVFDEVRARAAGRRAAPLSWLPEPGGRVATALSMLAFAEENWPALRGYREAFVDLQAFVPDEDAAAVEASLVRPGDDEAIDRRAGEVLVSIRRAQAVAISSLRDDDRVLGAYNALGDIDIVIGRAQRSLGAVDRYKETQTLGITSLATWPAGLAIGGVVGLIVTGVSIMAVIVLALLAVAGWVAALGPLYAYAVGTTGSRLDRLAMRLNWGPAVMVGRFAAQGLETLLFFGGPVVIGFAVVAACRWVGLP